MKRFVLISVIGLLLISFFSFHTSKRTKANISIWHLFFNEKELINSQDFLPFDTSVSVTLNTATFKKQDSIKFRFSFDVFGGIKYNTKLYLGLPLQKKVLVSEKITIDYAAGEFSAARLKRIADSCHCNLLEFQCGIDKQNPRTLVKIKLVN